MKFTELIRRSQHFGIERFGITFGLLSVVLISCVIGFLVQSHARDEAYDRKQAVYTASAKSDVAEVTLNAPKVCRSTDGTRAMVVLNVNQRESKVSDISTDASSYKARVTTIDNRGKMVASQTNPHPSGGIFVFGNSGYIGIYFVAPNGFARERTLLGLESSYVAKNSTKSDHDRWVFQFNLGADGVQKAKSLDTESFDPSAFYAECIQDDAEKEIRKSLDQNLSDMSDMLLRIKEAKSRVSRDGVALEAITPEYIKGDVITTVNKVTTLQTKSVAFGGFDFDWRAASLETGYIKAACGSNDSLTFLKYMKSGADTTAKSADKDPYTLMTQQSGDTDSWIMQDGSSVRDASDAVKKDCKDLEQLWANYGKAKQEYQVTNIYKLLDLDIEKDSMASVYTSNIEKDAFKVVG